MQQPSLFEATPLGPPGFLYRPDAMDAAEEAAIAARLARLDLRPFEMQGRTALRRVAYFGARYDGARAGLMEGAAIPEFLQPLRQRAADLAGLAPDLLVHALVNEYAPGAPIGWHRDKAAFGEVVGFSFLSPCTLRFRRANGDSWDRLSLILAPRSAYVLKGAARSAWEHSIPPVDRLRFSVTFRTLATPAS